jgi:hypothetical protein
VKLVSGLGDFSVIRHEKERRDSFFDEILLDIVGLKTNIRAHNVLDATIEYLGPPKFSRQAFWSAPVSRTAFIASRKDYRYTKTPFRPNSMSIPAITCERKGAKAILLFSGKSFRKD